MDKNSLFSIAYIAGIFGIMYFFMIRPQQVQAKKKKEMMAELQVKDKVVTIGGIYGTLTKVKDEAVMVKIAENVEVEVLKTAIMMKRD